MFKVNPHIEHEGLASRGPAFAWRFDEVGRKRRRTCQVRMLAVCRKPPNDSVLADKTVTAAPTYPTNVYSITTGKRFERPPQRSNGSALIGLADGSCMTPAFSVRTEVLVTKDVDGGVKSQI